MSLIRATDCLCWFYHKERCDTGRGIVYIKFLQNYTTRTTCRKNYSKYRSALQKWVATEKIKAQYQGQTYGQSEVNRAIKQARRYLNKCVKEVLKDENVLD